ncbi:FUSC family protein [Rhodobacter sp. 24-YEA-8]|uniref:FUSC family protein n=1 Tax=Rhodobacter sp. 24-YEA-8 TaxID=1884310 RepID=UPI00089B4B5E|nr:FUSC family protein [Rhodobacter sp. 24-YEA-8]SED39759.1 multidrug resistance protein MdtO [Rhodobacter sp. 24-YEA-8]
MQGGLAQVLARELAPVPGRLRDALALTGLVGVLVFLSMSMRVPEAALSCYLLFFAWRDNAGDGIFTAVKLSLAATFAVIVANPILQAVVDEPMLRLAALAAFTFTGMFLSQASRLGSLAGTAGFVFAFMLTLYDIVPVPELLSRALEWIWVVLVLPMVLLGLWSALAGTRPLSLIEARITARQTALANPSGPEAQHLLNEGMAPMDAHLKFARLMGEARGVAAETLAQRADDSYFALALAEAGLEPRPGSGATQPGRQGFFMPDAFTNPGYLQFAVKVLIAVLLTYGFYTVFGMFEIHTAMITCFYVALGTSGATRHKIMLRVIGCLMGAVAGVLAMVLVMPHATDIGWLLALIAPVTFLAAWIALGSERSSYAGWQMALCFYLVTLHGFAQPGDISAATDRIIGILIGSGVMYLVFAVLWPDAASAEARNQLTALDRGLASARTPHSGRDIARLRAPLALARAHAQDAGYEREAFPRAELDAAYARYLAFLRKSFHDAS